MPPVSRVALSFFGSRFALLPWCELSPRRPRAGMTDSRPKRGEPAVTEISRETEPSRWTSWLPQ